MDAGERELFAKAIDGAVAGRTGASLDTALEQLGWADALVADERAAVALLFEAQGRAGATSGALDRVLAGALGAAGSVVLPALGATTPPGRMVGDAVEVRGLGTSTLAAAGSAWVVVIDGDGTGVQEIAGLPVRPVGGLDPRLGLVEVTGSRPAATRPLPAGAWDEALAAGQRALAHELVGASRAMLELAREHAVDRIQFGVPIGSFQAVRHRLADAYVAIESAAAVADSAWEDRGPLAASAAKAVAGRSTRLVAKHCQQVLAGIGFTAEHPFHPFLRRSRVLDGLLGDSRSLTRAMGEGLLRAGALPPVLPL